MEEILKHKHLEMLKNLNNDDITKAENLYLENRIPESVINQLIFFKFSNQTKTI
jgi:hypothetical protein